MRIDFVTIFPDLFTGILGTGLIRHAREKGLLDVRVHDLRDYTSDRHRTVDDVPYGGGPGMVFKPEPLFLAVEALKEAAGTVVLPTPQGILFTQKLAEELAGCSQILFLCARYEGVDERVCDALVDREISIGDFVTMGGELPSLLMMEVIVRFVAGVVGDQDSIASDSFQQSLLDFPHYTRPDAFRGLNVPPVLLSGNHEQIRKWRRKMALMRTRQRRPGLLEHACLTSEDEEMLREILKDLK